MIEGVSEEAKITLREQNIDKTTDIPGAMKATQELKDAITAAGGSTTTAISKGGDDATKPIDKPQQIFDDAIMEQMIDGLSDEQKNIWRKTNIERFEEILVVNPIVIGVKQSALRKNINEIRVLAGLKRYTPPKTATGKPTAPKPAESTPAAPTPESTTAKTDGSPVEEITGVDAAREKAKRLEAQRRAVTGEGGGSSDYSSDEDTSTPDAALVSHLRNKFLIGRVIDKLQINQEQSIKDQIQFHIKNGIDPEEAEKIARGQSLEKAMDKIMRKDTKADEAAAAKKKADEAAEKARLAAEKAKDDAAKLTASSTTATPAATPAAPAAPTIPPPITEDEIKKVLAETTNELNAKWNSIYNRQVVLEVALKLIHKDKIDAILKQIEAIFHTPPSTAVSTVTPSSLTVTPSTGTAAPVAATSYPNPFVITQQTTTAVAALLADPTFFALAHGTNP